MLQDKQVPFFHKIKMLLRWGLLSKENGRRISVQVLWEQFLKKLVLRRWGIEPQYNGIIKRRDNAPMQGSDEGLTLETSAPPFYLTVV